MFLTLITEAAKVFRPYVAFTAYGAGVKNMVSAFETKSKYNNAFPIFNEEFTFQTTGDWKKIDIQISVKVSFRHFEFRALLNSRTIQLLARVQRWAFTWSPLESLKHYHKFANVPYCTNQTFSTTTPERCFLSWPTGLPIKSPRNSSKLNLRTPAETFSLKSSK